MPIAKILSGISMRQERKLTKPGVAPPAVTVWGDRKPSFYLIETRSTAGAVAINRLAAANIKAAWLDAPTDVNGFHYAAGSLVVPAGKNVLPALQNVTRP